MLYAQENSVENIYNFLYSIFSSIPIVGNLMSIYSFIVKFSLEKKTKSNFIVFFV